MKRAGIWLPAVSAVLLWCAYPPIDFGWAAWVALVPLVVSLREGGFWRGFRRGLWFGTLFFLLDLTWLLDFIRNWTGSWALAALPLVLLSVIEGLYVAIACGAVSLACRKWQWGLLLAPAAWAAMEHFRSVWPAGGFGWAQLSYSQWDHPLLLQPVAWAGTHLLAFIIVAVNVAIVCWVWVAGGRKVATWVGAGFVAVMLLSLARFKVPDAPPAANALIVAAVQPAMDTIHTDPMEWYPKFLDYKQEALRRAERLGADVAAFPEGYQVGEPWNVRAARIPYVITGQRDVGGFIRQTAYGIAPGRNMFDQRDKSRLVIFGEYVPWRDKLPLLKSYGLPGGDVSPGDPNEPPLTVDGVHVATAICFESIFSEVLRGQSAKGVDLLAVMTLDDWFNSTGKRQHAAASVVRAVENDRPLVRAASTGISMIVDRHGVVVGSLPEGKPGVLVRRVWVPQSEPKNIPLQVWFPVVCYVGVLAPIVWRRRPESSASSD